MESLAIGFEEQFPVQMMNTGLPARISSISAVDRVAAKYGIEVEETAVGFKYIGERLVSGRATVGGEQSAGFSLSRHLPEKDGILAGLTSILFAWWLIDQPHTSRELFLSMVAWVLGFWVASGLRRSAAAREDPIADEQDEEDEDWEEEDR